jgi:RecB family endonuclease NucS
MAIYKIENKSLAVIQSTSFEVEGILERRDLQRMLREKIEIISPRTLVIAEEFSDWEDTKSRLDLLGIDDHANLVVIELKRTETGNYMELQAVRYAAMLSTLTFDKAVRRYFPDEEDTLLTGDQEKIVVCNEWAVSNIGKFIERARELGFQITQSP